MPSDLVSHRAYLALIAERCRTRTHGEPGGEELRCNSLLNGLASFKCKDEFGAVLAVNVSEFDPFEAPQDEEGEAQRRQTKCEFTAAKA